MTAGIVTAAGEGEGRGGNGHAEEGGEELFHGVGCTDVAELVGQEIRANSNYANDPSTPEDSANNLAVNAFFCQHRFCS